MRLAAAIAVLAVFVPAAHAVPAVDVLRNPFMAFPRLDPALRDMDAAGDVNGDGVPDLIFGAGGNDVPDQNAAYVVFGARDGGVLGVDGPGFRILRASLFDGAGTSVAGVGDVNGDGLDDLLIGAPGTEPQGRREAGAAYVVFGKRDPEPVRLGELGAGGFRIDGAKGEPPPPPAGTGDRTGGAVAAAGDVNRDGLADLVVAAPGADVLAPETGAVYVVFGKPGSEPVDLAALGAGGYLIYGPARGRIGGIVTGLGDWTGDGRPDLAIGRPAVDARGRRDAGEVAIVPGQADVLPVQLAYESQRVSGPAQRDHLGASVADAGDVNGDGRGDLLAGAPGLGRGRGSVYVVLGGRRSVDLLRPGRRAIRIVAAQGGDGLGLAVSAHGRLAGRPAVLLGAPYSDVACRSEGGAAYVVPVSPRVQLVDLARSGYRIDGWGRDGGVFQHGGFAGTHVASPGDIDGDGRPEALVGGDGEPADTDPAFSTSAFVIDGAAPRRQTARAGSRRCVAARVTSRSAARLRSGGIRVRTRRPLRRGRDDIVGVSLRRIGRCPRRDDCVLARSEASGRLAPTPYGRRAARPGMRVELTARRGSDYPYSVGYFEVRRTFRLTG